LAKLHTFDTDYFAFRRRRPRRVKSLSGDALVEARIAFAAARTPVMSDNIKGRLILPEPQSERCPRLSFGRPCERVDYHHHDEAFGGGGMSKYWTQGTSPAPKKFANVQTSNAPRTFTNKRTRDALARQLRRRDVKIITSSIERTTFDGGVVTLWTLEEEKS